MIPNNALVKKQGTVVGQARISEWSAAQQKGEFPLAIPSVDCIFCTFLHWRNVWDAANDKPMLHLSSYLHDILGCGLHSMKMEIKFLLWEKNYPSPQKQINLTFNTDVKKHEASSPMYIAALWFWEGYHFFFFFSVILLCLSVLFM